MKISRQIRRIAGGSLLCFLLLPLVPAARGDYDSDGDGYVKAEAKHQVRLVTLADAAKPIHLRVGGYFDVHLPDKQAEISWEPDTEVNFRIDEKRPLHIWTLPQTRGEERGGPQAKNAADVFMYRAAKVGRQSITFTYGDGDKKHDRQVVFHFVVGGK